jgi:alkylhydroperoxidase family enzyme
MQRRPKLVRAFTALTAAVWDPVSEVDRGFKRLVAHLASRAHGCHY